MKNAMTRAAAAAALGIVLLTAGFTANLPVQEIEPLASVSTDTVTVAIEVGPKGFDPQDITLENDQPARIVFTRTVENTCAKTIHIPAFGVEATALPLNEPVAVEVQPEENGTFTFACAMDMMKGAILVKSE